MPNVYRYSINRLSQIVDKAIRIPMIALFPKLKFHLKMNLAQSRLMKQFGCRAPGKLKKYKIKSYNVMLL